MPGCLSYDREGPDAPLFPLSLPLNLFPFHLSLSIPRFSINNSSIHSPPASIYHLKVASAGTFLTKQLRDKLTTTSSTYRHLSARHYHSRRSLHPRPSTEPFPQVPRELRVYVNRKSQDLRYVASHSMSPYPGRPRPPSPLCIGH